MIDKSSVSFNISFLRDSAADLARSQKYATTKKNHELISPKLEKAKKNLNEAYRVLAKLAKNNQEILPAAEWLIDNFYIVQEQIVQVENDFPKEYQRSIPKLTDGYLKGWPRVYELVLNLVTYTDNLVDLETLTQYVKSYQEEETLMLGEVWAIPIMARFALIQQLSEKSGKVLQQKKMQLEVNNLVKEVSEKDTREPGAITHELTKWLNSKSQNYNDQVLLLELANQFQSAGLLQNEQKRWFAYRFNQFDVTLEEALRIEAQKKSRLQVSIQNAVVSLREVSESDWSDFVEDCSIVDQMLRLDPHGTYADMDQQTRDRYRRSVERISRHSRYSETEVTEQALSLAENYAGVAVGDNPDYLNDRSILKQHVGYYLLGDGYELLAKKAGYKMPFKEKIRTKLEHRAAYYIGTIGFLTLILLTFLWLITDSISESPLTLMAVIMISFFPVMDLSIAAVNRFFAFFLPPRILPKMQNHGKIPTNSRTLVVVPTLLTSPEDVRTQLETLEIRSLANPDSSLQFALLSDFVDADEQHLPEDEAIIKQAKEGITELNKKYRSDFGDKFFLLHRERLWNPSEEKWIGWERKRGKIEELNRMIYHPEAESSYKYIFGDFLNSIQSHVVQFVITLDADTKLPPESAIDLVRTASHPLNRAWYDPDRKRITKGYGIIQPRISIAPESARKTWFSRIFSGNVGLDPYSTAVSDIYQDLNGEAVFTGKGIFDVEAFHTVMENRLPVNHILSHDLIESTYLRAGLATDMELFDDYPTTYNSFSKRNHRWTRGDWQIAAWMFLSVPEEGGNVRNPINTFSKWKIFDNLRRSLNPFFLCLFFVAGWFWLPGSAWIWTLAGICIIAFPMYTSLSTDIVNRPGRVKWKLYLEKVRTNLKINSMQVLSTLIILPHQAALNLDAISRTLWRINVSGKKLLEWVTASQTEKTASNTVASYLRLSAVSVFLALGVLIAAIIIDIGGLWVAVPFSLLWLSAPFYTWYISQPYKADVKGYSKKDEMLLRMYARRIWFYFERFVTEEHLWLAPDNYQEDPPLSVAPRTSPTNIGLALVSTVIAYNRGYILFGELLSRIENTLNSLENLEQYKGHFYNWYDTNTGEVLHPKYISTVDSGNLVAGLIVVKEAIRQEINSKKLNTAIARGLEDTIFSIQKIFEELQEENNALSKEAADVLFSSTKFMFAHIEDVNPANASEYLGLLELLREDAANLQSVDLTSVSNEIGQKKTKHLQFWLSRPITIIEQAIEEFKQLQELETSFAESSTLDELIEQLASTGRKNSDSLKMIKKWRRQASYIVNRCDIIVNSTDFSFLYLKKRGLFTIGFNVEKSQADKSTYDLLASEARIASYIAIAKGEVPAEHWFRLSRRLTSLDKNEILLSWGGTMFEYLMPLLFMRSYPNTLLSHTYESIIRWQRNYGASRKNPWGFSESAYNFLNIDLQYQYRAFGAPGLGLKRGLAEEYVVAPYASMLSLMIDPRAAIDNLKNIEEIGGSGVFGFYDAIDFTPSHISTKENYKVVKTYMAHHHGMSLISIENVLSDWSIHNYFHSDQQIRSCDLLLQEKIPRGVPIKEPHPIDVELEPGEQQAAEYFIDHAALHELDINPPRGQLLSNGSYSTYVNHAGAGWSHFYDMALTGRDSDPTMDPLGFFFYIKDLDSGDFWSATHQPVKHKPDRYDTWFHNGKVITSRVDHWIESTVAVCVSPDYPMEFRKITLTNYSSEIRTLELTSYAEIILNDLRDHNSHPAFSKLFVQTEYLAEHHALIAKRRPRSESERVEWLVHSISGMNTNSLVEPIQFETDRAQFIGRGRSLANPRAMENGHSMNGSLGNVLDPIVSLRKKIVLQPGEEIELAFGLGRAESLEEAEQLANMYDTPHAIDRVFDLATVYSMVELNHIGINSKEAHYFQKLASYLLYPDPAFRAEEHILIKNRKKQGGLWPYGISGDFPLVVLRINDSEQIGSVRKLLKAHAFWRFKGLKVEILILNDHPPSYADEVQEAIHQEIQSSMEGQIINQPGGIFIQKSEKMPDEDLTLILSYAYLVFDGKLPALGDQFFPNTTSWNNDHTKAGNVPALKEKVTSLNISESELLMFNGYGGFSPEGDEYQIIIKQNPETGEHHFPPAPWSNIIANPNFGSLVTESGAGYTWSRNSRENKLTGWSNDPVKDTHSEAFYIRDEDAKKFWSPAPGPALADGNYKTSHGFGYTRFNHQSSELEQELIQFVPREEPVKISRVRLINLSENTRKISFARYQDLVLGVDRSKSVRHIIPTATDAKNVIYAQNFYNEEFAGRVAFAGIFMGDEAKEADTSFTTDRATFIGRNRSLEHPGAMNSSAHLNNAISTGGDVCAAFKTCFELEPGEEIFLTVLTGEADNSEKADEIIERFKDLKAVNQELEDVKNFWNTKLNRIQVQTPDNSLNLLMNGWLMYQNIASRMFARSAFYQAGGAFGFRDQLQDSMATFYADPEMTREQILLHASKQFKEGDVLHWWHPPTGRGIRSKISDDRLWLPYVTDFYIQSTGDDLILDEKVSYIVARLLEEDEHEVYLVPDELNEEETLYEHCCRAIDISLKFGRHGLPLIGAGDWNDGMNRVGQYGEGESIWLGFFIHTILEKFEQICRTKNDEARADRYRETAENLNTHLNKEGWDGEWYLRAFYDDGTPLGSSENDECKIDAISQAWSVITDVVPASRKKQVLEALENHLIIEHDKLIQLLDPPFDKTEKNPGYIKGYVPGVRENGGQYTHAALWVIKAFAEAGFGEKATQLLHMVNPVNHGSNENEIAVYKVEPYVVAADVYGEHPLTGRGGWTWYTGSAGWMYRVALESILGLRFTKHGFSLKPAISSEWKSYKLTIKPDEETVYQITIENPEALQTGKLAGTVDGEEQNFQEDTVEIPFKKDGKDHEVKLTMKR